MQNKTIAVLGGSEAAVEGGGLYTHGSYGRVLEALASRFGKVVLSVATRERPGILHDYRLPENVRLEPAPAASTALEGALLNRAIARAYRSAISQADVVFVRGVLTPAVSAIYSECVRQNKPICHWLVGNPMALLRSHVRSGWVKDSLGKLVVLEWERRLHRGHRSARAAYLCNGEEIAARHPSPRSYVTVSSTLSRNDFFWRHDTCEADTIKILCVGFIRPEKGIEYLIEGFSRIESRERARLILAGSRDRYPAYQAKLNRLITRLGIEDKVEWVGHIKSHQVAAFMRNADIFAFPSLSEGTPRVLVEARANCLPIVATKVGGVPTSVQDEFDGLLVPAKDVQAMANSIDRLIEDGQLRRRLIANGYERVKAMTVEDFATKVVQIYRDLEDSVSSK